jgi:hypothetical protein
MKACFQLQDAILRFSGLTEESRRNWKKFAECPGRRTRFALAERLGWRSVAKMETSMCCREYAEWIAYFNSERSEQSTPSNSTGGSRRKQMKVMRVFSEIQKIRKG